MFPKEKETKINLDISKCMNLTIELEYELQRIGF
jgi:hypothetical protein